MGVCQAYAGPVVAAALVMAVPVPSADLPVSSAGDSVRRAAVSAVAWDGTHRIRVYSTGLRPAVKEAAERISSQTCLHLVPAGRPDPGSRAHPYEVVIRFAQLPRGGPRARVRMRVMAAGTDLAAVDLEIRQRVLQTGKQRRRDIVLHELMHAVGVGDSAAPDSVMFHHPRKPYSQLSRADRMSLRSISRCALAELDCDEPGAPGIALGLHGGTGTGDVFAQLSGWRDAAVRYNLVPLTPTAPQASGRIWNIEPGSADMAALTELVETTVRNGCIDTDRIYVGGHSMGAMAASVLACSTRLFAAVAPAAGVVQPPGTCWPGTSIYAVHSDDDPVVWIDGDVAQNLHAVVPVWARSKDRRSAVVRWAATNDCRGSSWRSGSEPGTQHTEPYREQVWSCPTGVEVRWRVYDHVDHQIPASWAESTMEFFARTSR